MEIVYERDIGDALIIRWSAEEWEEYNEDGDSEEYAESVEDDGDPGMVSKEALKLLPKSGICEGVCTAKRSCGGLCCRCCLVE